MNTLYKKMWVTALVCISLFSCKKEDFVTLNTNPVLLDKITPEQQFMNASIRMHGDRLEWYYDNVRGIMSWMQMNTPENGNGSGFITEAGNFRNTRYTIFYPGLGASLVDVQQIIAEMSPEEQAKRANEIAIAGIVKAYYAFYVSDVNGSIAYKEAFQGKYDGTFTPVYDTQAALFDQLDTELKAFIATLSATTAVEQTAYGASDLFFEGNVTNWIKTANAVRLRMAMRLMKRDPAKMTTRVQEILANPTQMSSNDDSWVFEANANYAEGGDWSVATFRAPKPTIDFMVNHADPRVRIFYQPNYFTQENFNIAKTQGKIAASAVYNPRRYYGLPTNPATAGLAAPEFLTSVTITKLASTGAMGTFTLDTLSNLQPRLFAAGENSGTGVNFFPIVTYADFCLMRAELAARGITGENAKEWYDKGVTASIKAYDDMGNRAKITDRELVNNYVAVTDAEIATYLTQPDVVYNPATGLDQIACQAYLHFFKQPNEAWALFKRTGLPNSSSVIKLEKIIVDGTEQAIPRRALLPFPSPSNLNYNNIIGAYAEMQKDPEFGTGSSDIFGRVWWDKK